MSLAVYRTLREISDLDGGTVRRDFYFVAPAGQNATEAIGQRVSIFYADQVSAMGALIEMTHDMERTGA
jgi:hypothetical protein